MLGVKTARTTRLLGSSAAASDQTSISGFPLTWLTHTSRKTHVTPAHPNDEPFETRGEMPLLGAASDDEGIGGTGVGETENAAPSLPPGRREGTDGSVSDDELVYA